VDHTISNLEPETEYTVTVTVVTPQPQGELRNSESIDVRTANSSTARFAGEDWGRLHGAGKGNFKAGDYEGEKGSSDKKHGNIQSPAGSSGASSSTAAAAGAAARTTGPPDDTSTIAPSECGDAGVNEGDHNRFESISDDGSECDFPPPPPDPEPHHGLEGMNGTAVPNDNARAQETAEIDCVPEAANEREEVLYPPLAPPVSSDENAVTAETPRNEPVQSSANAQREATEQSVRPVRRLPQCNLCTMLDCMKRQPATMDDSEIVIGQQNEARAWQVPTPTHLTQPPVTAPAPPRRTFRPYRIPFPGRPVDPMSVGLPHLVQPQQTPVPRRTV